MCFNKTVVQTSIGSGSSFIDRLWFEQHLPLLTALDQFWLYSHPLVSAKDWFQDTYPGIKSMNPKSLKSAFIFLDFASMEREG